VFARDRGEKESSKGETPAPEKNTLLATYSAVKERGRTRRSKSGQVDLRCRKESPPTSPKALLSKKT